MIRQFHEADRVQVIRLIADLRVYLSSLKSVEQESNLKDAEQELNYYIRKAYPFFVHESHGEIEGYVVCRVVDDVVWTESLYVKPESRHRGIGSTLYGMVEELARQLGGDTVYNWVHPNNEVSIAFLKKRGYSVLNLIEIRKPWTEEVISRRICVGKNEFDY